MNKLWEKSYDLNKQVEAFTVGHDYILDKQLVRFDCQASIAHARMLHKIGILHKTETESLVRELENIIELNQKGEFDITIDQEDCHTAIENHLTEKLGSLGEKIHTGRSRNDQVLTALRLYYKEKTDECFALIDRLINSVSQFIEKYGDIALPGYTHLRKAMPSSIGLWAGALIESMQDNRKLLTVAMELLDQSPLGTGAGYGVPLDIDRDFTARELGFARIQSNPIYVQNSRGKLEATLLHALSQVMFDLNKLATDLIIFSMPEFGYFELPEEFCTGSSIMPHKKNPDVLEILQAKYHIMVANEFKVKTIVSNLISGYNRGLQLTKEPTMRNMALTRDSLGITCLLFDHLKVNRENCENALTEEVFATKKVYELVKQGVSFREAYKRVSKEY